MSVDILRQAVDLGAIVLAVLAAMVVVMLAGWVFQALAKNGGWTDVVWTFGTGACLVAAALTTWPSAGAPTFRHIAVAVLVGVWALRLGRHIALRVLQGPEDARYAEFRRDWGKDFLRNMVGLMLAQAPATALLSVSVILAARAPEPQWRVQDLVGAALLLISIYGEGVADGQLRRFKADPANKGKVCDTGLWAWSRHPNYFFEWLVWMAYPIIAIAPSNPLTWLSLVAPGVMYLLLTRVSGVPPLEKSMLASRGDLFRAYQARTSVFFPWPPKRGPSRMPAA